MTVSIIISLLISQVAMVSGQVFLKKGMAAPVAAERKIPAWVFLPAGIVLLAIWFMLWLGMMSRLDLGQQMPLEAISPIMIMAAGVIFLKEKCGWQGWLGLLLTAVGVYVVAVS